MLTLVRLFSKSVLELFCWPWCNCSVNQC